MTFKELIHSKGFTVKSFVEISGIDKTTYYNVLNRAKNPRLDTLEIIANTLDLKLSELVELLYETDN